MDTTFYNRKRPAHFAPIERHNRPTLLMVTTCVRRKRSLLASDEIHNLIVRSWKQANHWQVNRYVIMPDHLHFFCCPANRETSFSNWCSYWRNLVTRGWPDKRDRPLWQKDNWDTQIRTGATFTEKWHYIRNNPARRGLVSKPDDWPYQGEVFPFVWMEK